MKRHSVEVRPALGVRVVADDERNLARQLATLVPVEQIDQAVVLSGVNPTLVPRGEKEKEKAAKQPKERSA